MSASLHLDARAASLLQLLPAGARKFFCAAEAADLQALAASLADHTQGTTVASHDASDVVLSDSVPAADTLRTCTNATLLIFGAGYPCAAGTAPLQAHSAPAWFIEEAASTGQDLFAVCAKGTGRSVTLSSLQILDSRQRRQPGGMFGELAISSAAAGGRLQRCGAWGKKLKGGRIVLSNFNTAGMRIGGRWLDAQSLAARLRAIVGIRELLVMARRTTQLDPEIVIYWSATEQAARVDLERELAARADLSALTLVELPQLLFDPAGEPDWQRLAALPVIDERECRVARTRMSALANAEVTTERVLKIPRPAPLAQAADRPARASALPEPPDSATSEMARLEGPALILPAGYPRTLRDLLDRAASQHPDHGVRCIDGIEESVISYARLAERARAAAGVLQATGLRPGARIILHSGTLAPVLQWFWAAQYAAVTVTVLGRTGNDRRDHELLIDCATRLQAQLVICDDPAAMDAAGVPVLQANAPASAGYTEVASAPEHPALIVCTSGSSARPKLVPQTHAALIAHGYACAEALLLGPDDVSMNWMPIDHVGSLIMCHLCEAHRGCNQLHVSRDRILANPLEWLDLLDRHRVSLTWSPHFGYAQLVAALERSSPSRQWSLDCVRALINGGEAVVAETAQRCVDALRPYGLRADAMLAAWGMSETCSVALLNHSGALTPEPRSGAVSVGRPLAGMRFRVVDEQRALVRQGQIGSLEVSGPSVFRGYLDEADAAAGPQADGWFVTGDLGVIDATGLRIAGREKDVIIVNGQNVSCLALERLLQGLEELEPAHTCAVPHRHGSADTETAAIFVVPREGVDHQRAVRLAREALWEHMGLDALVLPVSADRIPRTAIGKAKRAELQKQLADGLFGSVIPQASSQPSPGATLPAWFFHQTWVARNAQPATRIPLLRWKVLSGPGEPAQELASTLGQSGCVASAVQSPGEAATDCEALLLPVGRPALDARSDLQLLETLRVLSRSKKTLLLLLLSEEALGEDACGSPSEAGITGAMFGLWTAFAREHRGWRLRWIDVPAAWSVRQRVSALLHEAHAGDDALAVRLRDKHRSICRLQPQYLSRSAEARLRPGARYVITGALGDLGEVLCRHLMTYWSASIIGVARPSVAAADGERHRSRAARLAALGEFHLLRADVTQPFHAQLQALLGSERRIDGLFHLAGAFRLSAMSELQAPDYQEQVATKLSGTLHALEALRRCGSQAAFIAAYGSSDIEVGGAGSPAYTAASVAQQFICAAASRMDIPAYYLAWSQWPGLGLTRANPLAPLALRHGLCDITPADGIRSLHRVLSGPPGTVLIGLDATHESIAARVAGPDFEPQLRVQGRADIGNQALEHACGTDRFGRSYPMMLDLTAPEGACSDEYRLMESRLTQLWQQVLGRPEVDVRRNFFELGGNSLRLLQAKSRLEQMVGRSVDVAVLFRHSTIERLAMYLSRPQADGTAEASARGNARRQALARRSS